MRRLSIALALFCAILLIADRLALAQSGSVGGTVGKTDKSVSGGETAPAKRAVAPNAGSAGSVAGRWRWSADCESGHWEGGFSLTQSGASEITGGFLHTNLADIGTISGHVSNGSLSFIRNAGVVTQHWVGQLRGGHHISGSLSGNENCTWQASRQ